MRFFGRAGSEDDVSGVRATALVVEADAPPEGAPPIGTGAKGVLRIRVDTGSGPRVVARKFRFREDHWLVPGMEVPVTIDPDAPEHFEVDWDAVPSMESRAAANDAALADPIGARRRVAEVLGFDPPEGKRFEEALAKAEHASAPAGKQRAVVLVATVRGRSVASDTDTGSGHTLVTGERPSAAVLSINVPGRQPYALYVRKFKFPHLQRDILGSGLPALVSATDPHDVEILWDELPGLGAQVATRVADSLATVGTAEAEFASGTVDMRAFAAQNAQRTLQFVQDPKMRKMLIEQYRAAGIDVGE